MDHLWTPWRYQYISSLAEDNGGKCIFCDIPQGDDETRLIICRGRYNYIVLNRFPYTSGHSMIVPFRHFPCSMIYTGMSGMKCAGWRNVCRKPLLPSTIHKDLILAGIRANAPAPVSLIISICTWCLDGWATQI